MDKQLTVSGYTMEESRRIVKNAPARLGWLDRLDTDYPALLELYRQHHYERHSDLYMMGIAFALGHAIGVRDERARHRGAVVVPPDQVAIDAAEQTIKQAEVTREISQRIRKLDATELGATMATLKAMTEGKSDDEAIEAGNAVLVAGGHKPLDISEVRRNAASLQSA